MTVIPCSLSRGRIAVVGRAIHLAPLMTTTNIPGMISGSFVGDVVRILTPEAEFTVRLDRPRLEIEAVFRESRACGGTWWTAWRADPATPDPRATAAVLVRHITESRRLFAEWAALRTQGRLTTPHDAS